MSTATVTTKGQITIPKLVRERLGVDPGDRVEFIEIEEGVFQLIVASRDIQSLKGVVQKLDKPVTVAEMNESIVMKGR